ncbi:MAG TPA: NAD(P)H-dependent oxidoreductase subunit E [bacterium]|nr:NAD(P)H-dependent oxidoreductase subunit E [bacterium]
MLEKQEIQLDPGLLNFMEECRTIPGNEIMILHKVQEIYGYVPRKVAMEVSRLMGIPLAKIYGIITFYHLFKLKKPGKYKISVCMGTACYLKGGNDLLDEIENLLGTGVNNTTEDGLYSIEAVRCIGCCGLAPAMTINNKVYGNVKKEKIADILGEYSNLEEAAKK